MKGPWASGIARAAANARRGLDRADPLGPWLDRLGATAGTARTDTDLALAVGDGHELFARLAAWPAPEGNPADASDLPDLSIGAEGDPARALARADLLRFMATFAGLEALAAGPGSAMARAFARGAVELSAGDQHGLGWLLRGIELSAAERPRG